MTVLASIGRALGAVANEGCACAVCGPSAFDAVRRSKDVFGPAFVDYDLVAQASAESVCEGCAKILGGKPSRANPPLRMGHFVVAGGNLDRVDGATMVATLVAPPTDIEAVGWAQSRQKHASLRCGPCTPRRLLIGCDSGTIDWRPGRDAPLVDAVSTLRAAARQDDIITGAYPPHTIQKLGHATWSTAEAVVATYRPGLHLDLVVAMVRRPEVDPLTEEDIMVPEEYRDAAEILRPLCDESALRRDDPIRFWGELLPRRLASAASSASLVEWMGYMSEALQVATSRAEVVEALRDVADMEATAEALVLGVLRRDHRLLVSFVRIAQQEARS